MQQTEKYKFNIIETSDAFSPDALNANARTAETQLSVLADADAALTAADAANKTALEQALASQKTALEQSIASTKSALQTAMGTAGKTCRIATGSYVGSGYSDSDYGPSITVDFRPLVLFVGAADLGTSYVGAMIRGCGGALSTNFYRISVIWADRKVSWYASSDTDALNKAGIQYYYVVIGESL